MTQDLMTKEAIEAAEHEFWTVYGKQDIKSFAAFLWEDGLFWSAITPEPQNKESILADYVKQFETLKLTGFLLSEMWFRPVDLRNCYVFYMYSALYFDRVQKRPLAYSGRVSHNWGLEDADLVITGGLTTATEAAPWQHPDRESRSDAGP